MKSAFESGMYPLSYFFTFVESLPTGRAAFCESASKAAVKSHASATVAPGIAMYDRERELVQDAGTAHLQSDIQVHMAGRTETMSLHGGWQAASSTIASES